MAHTLSQLEDGGRRVSNTDEHRVKVTDKNDANRIAVETSLHTVFGAIRQN